MLEYFWGLQFLCFSDGYFGVLGDTREIAIFLNAAGKTLTFALLKVMDI